MKNDERTMKIEEYMMAEAQKLGVVKMGTVRRFKNPNRWEKQLAPWFSEECRDKRSQYKMIKKKYGREHPETRQAYSQLKKCCKKEKAKFQFTLPDLMKYKPK